MTASAFEQDWYLFFQPYSTLYINQAYSEWNIIYTYQFAHVQLSNFLDDVILLPYSILVIPARFK